MLGLGINITSEKVVSSPYGPELVTNGGFDTDTTGWSGSSATLSVVSGVLRTTNDGAASGNANQSFTTVIGRTYRLLSERIAVSGTEFSIRIGNSEADGSLYDPSRVTSPGTWETTFVATATTTFVTILAFNSGGAPGTYSDFDNISVREVL